MGGFGSFGKSYFLKALAAFLAASLAPLLALSAALTSIAEAALAVSLEERGRVAVWALAERVSDIERGATAALAEIAASPEAAALLGPSGTGGSGAAMEGRSQGVVAPGTAAPEAAAPEAAAPETAAPGAAAPEAAARLLGLLNRESQANGGAVFALIPARPGEAGLRGWSSGEIPEEFDLKRFGTWGLARRAREAGGRTVLIARPRTGRDGRAYCLAAARLIYAEAGRDHSGEATALGSASAGSAARLLGMVTVEVPRDTILRAVGSGRELIAFDAELVGRGGLVAFSLSDPGREGQAALLPPFAPPPRSGSYEARLGELVVRLSFPRGLAEGLGHAMRAATAWGLGAAALVSTLLAILAARIVTRPVLALSSAIARVRSGELGARVEAGGEDEIGQLAASFNEMSAELSGLLAQELERTELLRRAELEALAARINPHFLYNTLNSIKSLAKLGRNPEIVETVARLGKILRSSADGAGGESTVGAELALARDYLEIERLRHGSRVAVEWAVEPGVEGLPLPRFILEPLAENAILHGLERCAEPWRLRVEGRLEGETALLVLEDDGPGASGEFFDAMAKTLEAGETPEAGGRIGLAATNRRIRLRFGPAWGLRVSPAAEGRGFRAELRIPAGPDRKGGAPSTP